MNKKVRDILIGSVVLASTLFAGTAFAGPDYGHGGNPTEARVCTQSTGLNVRKQPNTSSKVLTQVSKNSYVSIKGDYYDYTTYKTWYYILTSKGQGFVSGDFICFDY